MFIRPSWRPRNNDDMYGLMGLYPWALVVSNAEDGPRATNLPLLVDRTRGAHGVLVGHIARANEHSRVLQSATSPALAIFQGPYSYISATWYPDRQMPSTYYYTSVHCYGRVRVQSTDELERWITILNDRMESHDPNGWKISEMDQTGMSRRLPHIMGFEIEIERIEGKFKLGQDEPKADAMAACERLARSSDPMHQALSELVKDYNAGRAENS